MKLQEGENIIHELKPQPGILFVWFFSKVIPFAFPFIFIGVAVVVFFKFIPEYKRSNIESSFDFYLIGVPIAFAVLAAILSFIYIIFLRATYKYYITNHRCIFSGGILRRVQRSVPYHKITDVEMSQNIIERFLGISTLNIFTPGTGSIYGAGRQKAEISFIGLKDNETPAETINKILKGFKSTGQ